MRSKNIYSMWIALLLTAAFSACHKDKGNPQKEQENLPYSQYMQTDYGSYVEIPHSVELNPTSGITLEGWVRLDNTAGSNVFFYKKLYDKEEGYFVDVRERDEETRLYSYLGYSDFEQKVGRFPIHQWTHFAVTSDGHVRKHYINGELIEAFSESNEAFTPSSEPLFIAKPITAHTGLAEFRLWNVVRSQAEIKNAMHKDITSPMPGLIAIWPFEENAKDVIGGHDGILHNHPRFLIWDH